MLNAGKKEQQVENKVANLSVGIWDDSFLAS